MKRLLTAFPAVVIATITALLLTTTANASDKPYKVYDGNRIYYSAFNSSFIQPEVADSYDIVRGKNRGIVNIAVVPFDVASGGKTALIKGSVSNILQQYQQLDFFEVREGDSVYYLASFKFNDEEPLTFTIEVKPDPNKPSYTMKFQKTLYYDN